MNLYPVVFIASDVRSIHFTSGITACTARMKVTPYINQLPETVLRRILLDNVRTDDLLRYTSACARVCPEWWAIVKDTPAYALAIPQSKLKLEDLIDGGTRPRWLEDPSREPEPWETPLITMLHVKTVPQLQELCRTNKLTVGGNKREICERLAPLFHDKRAQVLKTVSAALQDRQLNLKISKDVGDEGAVALNASLHAMVQIPFTKCQLFGMTGRGMISLAPALQLPCWALRELVILNSSLDDIGAVALAKALPRTLHGLRIDSNFGDDGWMELAGVLPSLPVLEVLEVTNSGSMWGSMGLESAKALAAAVPQCPKLRSLELPRTYLSVPARAVLRGVAAAARLEHFYVEESEDEWW